MLAPDRMGGRLWREFEPPADIPADKLWNPEEVLERLCEAAIVIEKTGGRVLPKGYGNSMPSYSYDWGDRLAQQQQDWEDQQKGARDRNRTRRGVSAATMSRVEEAMRWPLTYLEKYDGLRKLLRLYLRCKARRDNFGDAVKRRGYARATAFRHRDKALTLIAIGLIKDRVEFARAGDEGP